MILRLILKREGIYKTKDIRFYWNEVGDHVREYQCEILTQTDIDIMQSSEMLGVEIIEEDSDK